MAYYEHAPSYGAYLLMLLLYYIFSWVIIALGAYMNRDFLLIKKPIFEGMQYGFRVFLKKWFPWLLIGLILWSVSAFKFTDYYLSTYSLTLTGTHFTSSELIKDMEDDEFYRFDIENMKKFGMPSFGILRAYKLQDVVREGLLVRKIDQVVITRGYPFLPVVKIYIYEVEGKKVKSLRTSYMLFPESPGGKLSSLFNFPFEMFFWNGGGGLGA